MTVDLIVKMATCDTWARGTWGLGALDVWSLRKDEEGWGEVSLYS